MGSIDAASTAEEVRGARPVALDLSTRQLEHARRLLRRAGASFPLVNADAERTPFADGSFDVVFSDHGATTFADPHVAVPEVARLLRPGGLFAFNIASPLVWLCWGDGEDPPGPTLVRDYFGLHELDDGEVVTYELPYGEWIRLFREHGLVVEALIEPRPAADATSTYWEESERDWARRWPSEAIWKVRKP